MGVVWFTASGSKVPVLSKDPISHCLEDTDYSELLGIMDKGLLPTKTPGHVAIVGGGIAGLTAAKVLEDVGHKVNSSSNYTLQSGGVKWCVSLSSRILIFVYFNT